MILMRQTAVWEIIKVIEGLDSQDGNRQPDREQAKVYTKDRAGNGGQRTKTYERRTRIS